MRSPRAHARYGRLSVLLVLPILVLCVSAAVGTSAAVAADPTIAITSQQGVWTNKSFSITFTITSTVNTTANVQLSYSYQIDGGAWSAPRTTIANNISNVYGLHKGSATLPVGPSTAHLLADGQHTIAIKPYRFVAVHGATPVAGTPANALVNIDTVKPPVPSDCFTVNGFTGADPAHNNVTGTLAVELDSSVSDPLSGMGSMRFIDTMGVTAPVWPATWKTYAATAAYTLTVNEDGVHTVHAQFKDKAGNVSETSAVVNLVAHDTTAPHTPVTGNDDLWHHTDVTLTLQPWDDFQIGTTYYTVDGGATQTGTSIVVPAVADGSNDGPHPVNFWSTDWVGNTEDHTQPGNSCEVRIDTKRPVTLAPRTAAVVKGGIARLHYQVTDAEPGSPTAIVTIKIKNRAGTAVKVLRLRTQLVNVPLTAKFRCRLAKGTYRFFVYAVDQAGNAQATIGRNKLTVR